MTRNAYVIFPPQEPATAWRVARVTAFAADTRAQVTERQVEQQEESKPLPQQVAAAVRAALESLGYAGGSAALLLPSNWCLAASIAAEEAGWPHRRHRRRAQQQQAMLYRLEEQLPLSAEQIVADFVLSPSASTKGDVLAVAVELSRLAPLVAALEDAGVAIELISPSAVLAADQWLRQQRQQPCKPDLLAWCHNDHVDWFTVAPTGTLRSWKLVPARAPQLRRALRACTLEEHRAPSLVMLGFDEAEKLDAALGDHVLGNSSGAQQDSSLPPRLEDQPTQADSAAQGAAAALAGALRPSVNLRTGPLASADPLRQVRRPLLGLALCLLASLTGLLTGQLTRAHRYERVATQAEAQQQQLFARAMPGKRLPIDPALVLAAELRRLKALAGDDEGVDSGSAGDEGSPAELWSASSQRSVLLLLLLRQALALLPAPEVLRYRVLELRLDARRLQIEGQARSHGDAEAIATALRNGGIFDPEPPRSEQLPSKPGDAVPPGVSFSLVAAVNVAGQDQRKPDAVERREAK